METAQSNLFKGKVAVITGAGIGIGFEIAWQLAQQGAAVVVNDIDRNAAEDAKASITAEGGKCEIVVGDSGELDCIDKLVSTAIGKFGQLDLVIANAGITMFGDFLNFPLERFQKVLKVNLQGTFFLAQRTARQLIRQGTGGSILLMSSVTGLNYHPDLSVYAMSKAAIMMLAKSLGVELAPHGITVNALAPGATLTERTRALNDGKYDEIWSRLNPTGRPLTTAEIAHAALFLLSPNARQIIGQTLVVDGGWSTTSSSPDDL